ncbi:MAG: RNA polymerase sigma factor RpoE [Actinobacteria bacterium TMED172]|nr:RNA polymerase sigma factor RpoE [Cellvibrionales bacterium]OUW33311.1 MAG: RNA polymerase sigma factor RpoE [Actinobacteria bacterium TMED172]|tara:strand:+ start:3826 stop:4401 length:576 start_codon:yes stop_codon:yes gene_type:complete
MKDTDAQLVVRVQQGDKRAFDLLVLKYQHKIHSLISRYVRDQTEVQDVAQEAFVKAYRAINNFRAESAFYTWMYRIAINTAKNYLVSRSRRPPATDVDIDESVNYAGANVLLDQQGPESILHGEEVALVVRDALESLPEDLRTAVTLREFDGLSYEDIADVMDCPVGTVRSRIFRARDAIDKQLGPALNNR